MLAVWKHFGQIEVKNGGVPLGRGRERATSWIGTIGLYEIQVHGHLEELRKGIEARRIVKLDGQLVHQECCDEGAGSLR
jgi:hypothetical protein